MLSVFMMNRIVTTLLFLFQCEILPYHTSSARAVTDDILPGDFLKTEEQQLAELKKEAESTGEPFEGAWLKSELQTFYELYENHEGKPSKDLREVYRNTQILNLAEIRILIAYCYKEPPFFRDLNQNLREHEGTKYPIAKEVLKEAVLKLFSYQKGSGQGLPSSLYRNEPEQLFDQYQKLFNISDTGTLKQFTSTSRSLEAAQNFTPGADRMIIVFENPEIGGDVDDFSIFDEFEVLLPFSYKYWVLKADMDNENKGVILSGPFSDQVDLGLRLISDIRLLVVTILFSVTVLQCV